MRRTALLILAGIASLKADVNPSALFSDHMVLQSGMAVPVWGVAGPGERVTVTLNGQKRSATASADGKWMVRLKNLKPGGPFQMTIAGNNTITVNDVLVGEVWLGSGQSNMAFTVSKKRASWAGLIDEEQEIAAANYPSVRMFTAKPAKTYEPQTEIQGEWLVCTPENVPGFSAVGYLFSRDLQREIKEPVGISHAGVRREHGGVLDSPGDDRRRSAAETDAGSLRRRGPVLSGPSRRSGQRGAEAAQTINARPGPTPQRQRDPVQDQHNPTVLFNGMINPAIPYAIRGAIWYQGESIVGGKEGVALYPHVQETLIRDWRKLWGEGDFPFYVVQLPALQNISNNPLVREGQAAVRSLRRTAMAVTIDIGDPKDVHPHNKAPLGDRLTRIALANVYGRKMEYSGPVYESMKARGHAIRSEVLARRRRPGGQGRAAEVVRDRRRRREVRTRRSEDRGRHRWW